LPAAARMPYLRDLEDILGDDGDGGGGIDSD
jgi:hypothetical protein